MSQPSKLESALLLDDTPWRVRVLSRVLNVVAVLGGLLSVPSALLSLHHEMWLVAVTDVLGWLLVIIVVGHVLRALKAGLRAEAEAERSLARSEQRFRELADAVPIVVWTARPDGTIDFTNQAGQENVALGRDEMLGDGWTGLLHPDDVPRSVAAWRRALETGAPLEIEHRIRLGDGSAHWHIGRATPVRDDSGAIVKWYGTHVDVHAVRVAEEESRRLAEELTQTLETVIESEQRLTLITRATNDAIWDWNLATGGVWRSDGFRALFGYAPEELGGTMESWLSRVHPDDRQAIRQAAPALVAGDIDHYALEYRFLRKDGSYAWVHNRAFLLRDPAGRPSRVIGGLTDMSERRASEERLLRTQRLESLGTLAGGIAHDLNNVLLPILVSLDLLREGERSNERLADIATIEECALRGSEMVKRILAFARGYEGTRAAVSVETQVREVERLMREALPKGIDLRVSCEETPWVVVGDATHIHQVLVNLCVNARDAMPEGGTLRVTVENQVLDEAAARAVNAPASGPYVVLRVEDNGRGMEPAVLERVFEPFFTTKPHGEGTGLGLSTTHAIVKSHGGCVSVDSTPGVGTAFSVYLPARPEAVEPEPPAPRAEPSRGRGECVLIVDDEPGIRKLLRRVLERAGYRVLAACRGADALDLLAGGEGPVDVVLTDMAMPGMDGAALVRRLRARYPAVPVVGMSGLDVDGKVAAAREAGMRHFIAKPYTPDVVLEALRAALGEPSSAAAP